MNRNRLISSPAAFLLACLCLHGQEQGRNLHDYITAAKANSPLIADYRNQTEMQQAELERLKAVYTRSTLELNGEYLFVPIVSKDGGKTSFQWNAQDGTDYYGYDLGESSGHLHAGVTWTQPLLGGSAYKVAKEQTRIQTDIHAHQIRMEEHQLERSVTEQYLLCLLDKRQADFADSVRCILERQRDMLGRLAAAGQSKQTDIRLIEIELAANEELKATCLQSYRTHLADLNILCGLRDTAAVRLEDPRLRLSPAADISSAFLEQYRLDSLNTLSALKQFNLQYRPQLNLFVDGGMRIADYAQFNHHPGLGWSAGLTFRWTLFDGRQKRWKEHQATAQLNSIRAYRDNFLLQNDLRKHQYLSELRTCDERSALLEKQLKDYETVLDSYRKEIQAGQLSVLDYITVLRNRVKTSQDYMLLQANRLLLITAYNYWNW